MFINVLHFTLKLYDHNLNIFNKQIYLILKLNYLIHPDNFEIIHFQKKIQITEECFFK